MQKSQLMKCKNGFLISKDELIVHQILITLIDGCLCLIKVLICYMILLRTQNILVY